MRGYDGWGDYHSDESECDEQIMHLSVAPWWGSSEPLNTLIMTQVTWLRNSTNTLIQNETVLCHMTLKC